MEDPKIITDFIRYLRFTDGIASSDIISWLLAAVAGIIAYRLIDNMQTSIGRHTMLSGIEDSISAVFDSLTAISVKDGNKLSPDNALKYKVMVRSVLHDFTDWQIIYSPEDKNRLDTRIIENQRYVHIRDDGTYDEWISTQALHELCLKMRRVEKMFKGRIVKRVDLSDLFREIIPLGMNGRLEFLRKYYGDYDSECIAYLIIQTIVSCHKYHNDDIVKEFKDWYRSHEDIHILFEKNRRVRMVTDSYAVLTFGRLMQSC